MNELKEVQLAEKDNFFPPVLDEVFNCNLPNYDEVPKSINVSKTGFTDLLSSFRSASTGKLVQLIKGKTSKPLTPEKRQERSKYWRTEYGQHIFESSEKIALSQIIQGGIGEIRSSTSDLDSRLRIHTHPSETTFSPGDYLGFFYHVNREKSLEENLEDNPKLPSIQAVSTDEGYFLAFPTKGTRIPEYSDIEIDFFDVGNLGNFEKEKIETKKLVKKEYRKIWRQLIEQYGKENLASFTGEKKVEKDIFPVEVNDRGIALLQLYKILELNKKYKIYLGYMENNGDEFRQIKNLSDVFPEILN